MKKMKSNADKKIVDFFKCVISENILTDALEKKELVNINPCDARALRSDLRRNDFLRSCVNDETISIKRLLELSYEERATENIKKIRESEKKQCVKDINSVTYIPSPEERAILWNKIEDP